MDRVQEIPTLELTSGSRSYLSKEMVLTSLYIKRSNKGGAFIAPRRVIKSGGYQIIFGKGRALIRERRLFE